MTGNLDRDPVQDAFDALRTETQGLDTLQALRRVTANDTVTANNTVTANDTVTATNRSGFATGRRALIATAGVIVAAVIGFAAWFGADGGQPLDTANDTASDGATDEGQSEPATIDSLAGTTWILRAGSGPSGEIVLVDGFPITLTFDADTFGGTAACNGYGSSYSIDGDQIEIDGVAANEMGCQRDVQAAEQSYFAALGDVGEITLVGDELVLGGPATELIFSRERPAPTGSLVDTIWLLDTMIDGETASTVLGDPATLFIGSDGTFNGSTGCRTFSGRYQTLGADVQFNEFAAGPEECPSELRDQDSHVFGVLGDGFTAEIDGLRLIISSTGGQGLGYRAVTGDGLAEAAPRPVVSDAELLAGIKWVLVAGYGDPDSPDLVTIDPNVGETAQAPTLMFVDGGIRGFSGCNEFSAMAEVGNGSITVGRFESETQACDPPMTGIERQYLDSLAVMTEFGLEADGQRLVMNGGGVELHFERAG